MQNIELAVVVNSYNRLALLKRSIESLLMEFNNSELNYAIVIFDANSTDGSIEWIIEFIKDHSTIKIQLIIAGKGEPDSFSYGVNVACEYAIKNFPSLNYLFLYETDNFILSYDPIRLAIRLLNENSNVAACGYTVQKHNGTSAGFGCSFPSFISFLLGQQLSFFFKLNEPKMHWIKNEFCEFSYCDVVYTSPLLIQKEIWHQLKGFDYMRFPFSDCDIDLADRIHFLRNKMAVINSLSVIHDNLEIKSSWSATRSINYYKARLTFFKKKYGKSINFVKPILFFMHLFELGMLFILFLLGKRKGLSLKTRWTLVKSVFSNYEL